MDNQTIIRLLLIIVAAFVLFILISYYNKSKAAAASANKERFRSASASDEYYTNSGYANSAAPMQSAQAPVPYGAPLQPSAVSASSASSGPMPAEPLSNDQYRPVEYATGPRTVKECNPRDRLTTEDLLPKDAANSKWAQANPAGQGDVKDQNFLTAGYLLGVNTVGQSLRNANLQLRSEPPNPQLKVSPWSQSTIEPDVNRRPLELGENC